MRLLAMRDLRSVECNYNLQAAELISQFQSMTCRYNGENLQSRYKTLETFPLFCILNVFMKDVL